MIVLAAAAALCALAIVILVGTRVIEQNNPPQGSFVEIDGGRLHIVELGPTVAPPVVLLHGASGNLGDLRLALGDRLASSYRVILVDRPGHGSSDRLGGRADASPARQAELIHQALTRMGVRRPILLGHSWSGTLATAYALAYPDEIAGLVLLAPVTHPWPGGVGWINNLVATPIVGPAVARTLVLPFGFFAMSAGVDAVFAPQAAPADYVARAGATMILRPSEFIANAQDLSGLKEFVTAQAQRYGEVKVPVAILAGSHDTIVSTDIHARALAAAVPHAKLTVIPGIGHMVQFAAADRVVEAIDDIAKAGRRATVRAGRLPQ